MSTGVCGVGEGGLVRNGVAGAGVLVDVRAVMVLIIVPESREN